MDVAAGLFVDAVKMSAPVIAVLTFVNTGFGLVAKFSPQTNVMIVAFPVKIVVGLIFFAMTLPIIAIVTRDYIEPCRKLFLALLFYMGGG